MELLIRPGRGRTELAHQVARAVSTAAPVLGQATANVRTPVRFRSPLATRSHLTWPLQLMILANDLSNQSSRLMRPNPRRSGRPGSGSLDGDRNAAFIPTSTDSAFCPLSRRDMHARAYLRTHIHARNREAAGERQNEEKRLMMAEHAGQNRGGVARGVSRTRNLSIAALRSRSSQ